MNSPPDAGCERTPFAINRTLTHAEARFSKPWWRAAQSMSARIPHTPPTQSEKYKVGGDVFAQRRRVNEGLGFEHGRQRNTLTG